MSKGVMGSENNQRQRVKQNGKANGRNEGGKEERKS